jgi:hypothetical protein
MEGSKIFSGRQPERREPAAKKSGDIGGVEACGDRAESAQKSGGELGTCFDPMVGKVVGNLSA